MTILVFAEKTSTLIELCSGARQLGDRVEAVVIGEAQGGFAEKVWNIPAQADAMFEDYTETIAALVEKLKPNFLLVEPTKRCKLVVGRLAAMLGASVITDVSELTSVGEAKHMVYGGAAVRKEKAATSTAIVTVGSGLFTDAEPVTLDSEVETVEFVAPAFTVKLVSKEQKPKASADQTVEGFLPADKICFMLAIRGTLMSAVTEITAGSGTSKVSISSSKVRSTVAFPSATEIILLTLLIVGILRS